MRRWVSLCSRALIRDFISEVTFSSSRAACCFSPRLVETSRSVSSFSTTRATMARTALVPSTSLVWPSNCGSARRTVTTAVRPGEGVVLLELVAADLEPARVELELAAQHLEQRLVEAGQVGAALGGGDDVDERGDPGVVAGAPAHRDVDGALALDLGGAHVALGVEHRHGLLEGAGALQPPHVGDRRVGREELAELRDAAVVEEDLLGGLLAALVADDDGQPRHEERGLPGPGDQAVEVEGGVAQEDLRVGPVAHPGAGDPAAGACR